MNFARTIGLAALLAVACTAAVAADQRGYLGVTLTSVQNIDVGKEDNGVYIDDVIEGSAAALAGLEKNDRILSVNGVEVRSLGDLHRGLADTRPHDTVAVSVLRDGARQTFDVRLSEYPHSEALMELHENVGLDFEFRGPEGAHGANVAHGPQGDDVHFRDHNRWAYVVERKGAYLGVRVEQLNPQLAAYFQVDGGVLVTEVIADTPAAAGGLQAGDVLTAIEGKALREEGALNKALSEVEPGREVELLVQRRGRPLRLWVEAGEPVEHSFTIDLQAVPGLSYTPQGDVQFRGPEGEGEGRVLIEVAPDAEQQD
jgi:S1-C subfamily serine protease